MTAAPVTTAPATTASATAAPAARPRLDFLDGVRALAALYVVLHHIWITTWPDYPRNTGPVWVGWLVYGHVAVSVFIVLSGFSLAIGPARREWALPGGARTFLRRRAWRILPTYWAALALSCLVFGVVTADLTGDKVSLRAVVVHALLLQDVVDSPKPNGAFWSIAVEWQIYFLFPLLLLVRRRFGARVLVALSTVVVVGVYLAASSVPALDGLLNLTPQFAALFVLGIAAATVVRGGAAAARTVRRCAAGAVAAGVALVGLCLVAGPVRIDAQYFWVDLLVGAGTACALAALAGGRFGALRRVLASPPLRGTGRFSYSIYCVHLPLLWLVWHFGVDRWTTGATSGFLALVAVGLPVVLVGSALFARVFELPFLEHRSLAELRAALRPRPTPAVRGGTTPSGPVPAARPPARG